MPLIDIPGFAGDPLSSKVDLSLGLVLFPYIVTPTTTSIPNGAMWVTSAGVFARVNGATVGPFSVALTAAALTALLQAGTGTPANRSSTNWTLGFDTTTATPAALTTNLGVAAANNQIVLANASAVVIHASVIARQNTTGDCKGWTVDILARRGAAAANMEVLSGTPVVLAGASAGAAAWTLGVVADTTNGCVQFTATGEAAKSIKWAASCDVVHVVT